MLAARGVTFTYPRASRPALEQVSLTVERRELVAVVGPNGSGKTSLVHLLLGLLEPDAGELTLNGRPISAWSVKERAQRIGFLPQREAAGVGWRVADAVLLGRYARLGPLAAPTPVDREAVARAMVRADVAELGTRPIEALSGGEWQRVRIARALAQEPEALVLDEPNAGLDLGHEMEVFELIRALVDEGMAALVVTHDLNLAARFADRMVVLHQGRAAATGTPATVMRPEILEPIFRWPVEVAPGPGGVPQLTPRRRGVA